MAYKAEVIADSSGKWVGNALVFATEEEATIYVADLYSRWTLVRETRVVETDEAPNYRVVNGAISRIEEPATTVHHVEQYPGEKSAQDAVRRGEWEES